MGYMGGVYMGGVNDDERHMYETLVNHFALRLHEERSKTADLTRQLDCMRERISILETGAYGAPLL
jgi:hypothetical protein